MACLEVKEEKDKVKKSMKLMAPALGTDKVLCNTSVDGRRRFFIADRALKLTPLGGDLVLQLLELLPELSVLLLAHELHLSKKKLKSKLKLKIEYQIRNMKGTNKTLKEQKK